MHWISQYTTVNVSAGRGKRPKRAFWASVAAVALAALTRPQAAGTRFVTQTEHAKRATGSEGPRERVRSILGSISSHFSRFLTVFRRTVCSQRGVAPRREPSLVSGANTYPRAGLEHFRPSGAGVTAARASDARLSTNAVKSISDLCPKNQSPAPVALAALTRPQAAGTRFVTQTEHAKRATGSAGPRESVGNILGSISSQFCLFLTAFRRTVSSQRGGAPRRESPLASGASTHPGAGLEHFGPYGAGVTAAREGADCSGFVSLYSWSLQASKPQQTGGAQHGRSSRRSAQYGCFPCRIGYRWHRTERYGHLRCRWRALKAGIGCFD
jgi:hypothetical protein